MSKLMLHSYINAFTRSGYVAYTYHSPVNVHVTATYCILIEIGTEPLRNEHVSA